jgi:spectrin beta
MTDHFPDLVQALQSNLNVSCLQEKFLTTIIITDDIEELAIMKHRFDSFEHEMNANASKVAVVNQLARQLLQVEHPNAAEVIAKQNDLNDR